MKKERERHKERDKDKESKEKKRESKPFKETEMRNGLDSKEREKIKKVAQMMKDSLKDESSKKSSETSKSISSLGKIPKKKPEDKEDSSKKAGLSFEALMGAMDGSKTTKTLTKAPPIKNKNKDLLASFSSPSSASIRPKPSLSKPAPPKDFARDLLRPMMRTEDKSSKIMSASDLAKAGEKRAAEKEKGPPKQGLPSTAWLAEANAAAPTPSNDGDAAAWKRRAIEREGAVTKFSSERGGAGAPGSRQSLQSLLSLQGQSARAGGSRNSARSLGGALLLPTRYNEMARILLRRVVPSTKRTQ